MRGARGYVITFVQDLAAAAFVAYGVLSRASEMFKTHDQQVHHDITSHRITSSPGLHKGQVEARCPIEDRLFPGGGAVGTTSQSAVVLAEIVKCGGEVGD